MFFQTRCTLVFLLLQTAAPPPNPVTPQATPPAPPVRPSLHHRWRGGRLKCRVSYGHRAQASAVNHHTLSLLQLQRSALHDFFCFFCSTTAIDVDSISISISPSLRSISSHALAIRRQRLAEHLRDEVAAAAVSGSGRFGFLVSGEGMILDGLWFFKILAFLCVFIV